MGIFTWPKPTKTEKHRELETLRNQVISDKGDQIAMVKGFNVELGKILNKLANGADVTLADINKLQAKIR